MEPKNQCASWQRLARPKICAIVGTLLAAAGYATAQTSTPPPAYRDSQALNLVQASLAALGGQAAFSAVQDATVNGSCTPTEGSTAPQASGSASTAESSSSNDVAAAGAPQTITWITAGDDFRYESSQNGQTRLLVSSHGLPVVSGSGTTEQLSALSAAVLKPYHIPGLVLAQDVQDTNWGFRYVGEETIAGVQAVHVRIQRTARGWPIPILNQEWYFNPTTHLPIEVQYHVPSDPPSRFYGTVAVTYSSFSAEQTPVPQQILVGSPGSDPVACTLAAPSFNTHPQSTEFAISQ
jgi:hypothetical protein